MDQARHVDGGQPTRTRRVSRRALLRGRLRGTGRSLAEFGAACIARQGVVCRLCGDRCEVGAIRFAPALGGRAAPILDAAGCTGCGDCVVACPAAAIAIVEMTP